jgi:hypothetical protein
VFPEQGYYTIDSRHLPSSQHSRKSLADKKLLLGVKQFNLDPKKGLDFLDKAGFLDSANPEEVANFLFREGRLSKKQIGAFIGDHRDLNKLVLKAFVAKHEFMNLILVQALRQFLWSFRYAYQTCMCPNQNHFNVYKFLTPCTLAGIRTYDLLLKILRL